MLDIYLSLAVLSGLWLCAAWLFSFKLYSPVGIFYGFNFLYFFIRPSLLLLGLDSFYRTDLILHDPKLEIIIGAFYGAACVILTVLMYRYTYIILPERAFKWRLELNAKLLRLMLKISLVVATSIFTVVFLRFGSAFEVLIASRTGVLNEIFPYAKSLALSFSLLGIVSLFYSVGKHGLGRAYSWGILIVTSAFFLLLGERSELLYPAIIYICARYSSGQGFSRLLVLFGSGAIFSVLFIVRAVRGFVVSGDGEVFSVAEHLSNGFRSFSAAFNMQVFDHFVILLQRFDGGETLGTHLGNGIFGLVPRLFWEGKPDIISPGVWFKDQFYNDATSGMPFTQVGVWWIDLGIIGLVIMCVGTALLLRACVGGVRSGDRLIIILVICFCFRNLTSGFSTMFLIDSVKFVMMLFPVFILIRATRND